MLADFCLRDAKIIHVSHYLIVSLLGPASASVEITKNLSVFVAEVCVESNISKLESARISGYLEVGVCSVALFATYLVKMLMLGLGSYKLFNNGE